MTDFSCNARDEKPKEVTQLEPLDLKIIALVFVLFRCKKLSTNHPLMYLKQSSRGRREPLDFPGT